MPVLLREEERFADIYASIGRPNWSVARILGLMVLQEMHDFADQVALDQLSFDVRWQVALDLEPEDAYLSRRSYVGFRRRLVEMDPEMTRLRSVFEAIGGAAIDMLGISVKQQRIDSTHVASNIRTRGRVDLFSRTLLLFMREASRVDAASVEQLPSRLRDWVASRTQDDGWADRESDGPRVQTVETLANWLLDVKEQFADHAAVRELQSYQLVCRLLDEHCILEQPDDDPDDDDSAPPEASESGDDVVGEDKPRLQVRKKPERPGTSLQSPFDPDAGYSAQKGVGYSVHLTETTGNLPEGKPEIITDFEGTSAGERDFGQVMPTIGRLEEAGRKPETLYGDGHYTSGGLLLAAGLRGVVLYCRIGRGRLPADMVGRESMAFGDNGDLITCPMGHAPTGHTTRTTSKDRPSKRHAKMDRATCEGCELLGQCVSRPANSGKGDHHIDIEPDLRARDEQLAKQETEEWKQRYRIRSGIEATNSELKRKHGLGALPVRGRARVMMRVALKLTACNTKRWLAAVA